jgi:hypothetical protein
MGDLKCRADNGFRQFRSVCIGVSKNYFRYDASNERQYFRSIEAVRKRQNDRIRNQRLAEQQREIEQQVIAEAAPETFAEISPEPPAPQPARKRVNGFVSSSPLLTQSPARPPARIRPSSAPELRT